MVSPAVNQTMVNQIIYPQQNMHPLAWDFGCPIIYRPPHLRGKSNKVDNHQFLQKTAYSAKRFGATKFRQYHRQIISKMHFRNYGKVCIFGSFWVWNFHPHNTPLPKIYPLALTSDSQIAHPSILLGGAHNTSAASHTALPLLSPIPEWQTRAYSSCMAHADTTNAKGNGIWNINKSNRQKRT